MVNPRSRPKKASFSNHPAAQAAVCGPTLPERKEEIQHTRNGKGFHSADAESCDIEPSRRKRLSARCPARRTGSVGGRARVVVPFGQVLHVQSDVQQVLQRIEDRGEQTAESSQRDVNRSARSEEGALDDVPEVLEQGPQQCTEIEGRFQRDDGSRGCP